MNSEINYDNIYCELLGLQNDVEKASREKCIETMKILVKSLNVVNVERGVIDNNEYCKRNQLGIIMVDIIKSYGDHLKECLENNINRQNSINNSNTFKSETTLVGKPNRAGSNGSSVSFDNTAIKPNKGKNVAQDDASIISSYSYNDNSRKNSVSNRKGSTLKNSINIDGTEINFEENTGNEELNNEEMPIPNSMRTKPQNGNLGNKMNLQQFGSRIPYTSRPSTDSMGATVMMGSPTTMMTTGYTNGFVNVNPLYYDQVQYKMQMQYNQINQIQNQNQMPMPNQMPMQMQIPNHMQMQMPYNQIQNQNQMQIPNQMANQIPDGNNEGCLDQNSLQERFLRLSVANTEATTTTTTNNNNNNNNNNNSNNNNNNNNNEDDDNDNDDNNNNDEDAINESRSPIDEHSNSINGNGLTTHLYSQFNGADEPEPSPGEEVVDVIENGSKDNFIGNYICIKNYIAEDDAYIDLEAGDIVSIAEFSGTYALGFNCRTEKNGLFPIYDIDSLNGFAIFYRVLEDNEEANKNDAIFVVSEADSDLLLGYNITKGEAGLFTMDQLEVLQFDSDNNPIFDEYQIYNINNGAIYNDPQLINGSYYADQIGYPFGIYPVGSIDGLNFNPNIGYINPEYSLMVNDKVGENPNILNSLTSEPTEQPDQPLSANKERHKKVTVTDHEHIKRIINHCIEKETEFNDKMKSSVDILIAQLEERVDTNDEILNKVDIGRIFKYFPELLRFSTELLNNLKDCMYSYDNEGVQCICKLFSNDNFDCSPFVKYSENYQNSLDAYDNIKKESIDKVQDILKRNEDAFHRQHFKDIIDTPINHFVTYRLILKDIQKKVFEDDIYDSLEEEVEHLDKIGENMNNKVGESIQIRKFFELKNIVYGFPPEFITSKRKLKVDFDIMGNVRGSFRKHVYLFNDCLMVVSTNKDAKKRGYKYELEKIMKYKDYDFVKGEQGAKLCIKCICKNNSRTNDQGDGRIKSNGSKHNGFFKTKSRKSNYDDKTMYLYFDNPATYSLFLQEGTNKPKDNNRELASSSN